MSEFSTTQKDFLENLFLKLNSTIDIKTSEIRLEIGQKIEEIKAEITKNNNNLEIKIAILEEQNKKLIYSALSLERKIRKNNIAIFGIGEDNTDLANGVCNIFKNILGLKIETEDINDVYRINSKENKKSPIIVEFISYQNKIAVLKNAKKLKGSNIYVTNDQCIEDQQNNKVLVKHLKEARSKGLVAYIKGGKLFISNEPYTVEQLKKGLTAEQGENLGKEDTRNVLQQSQPISSECSTYTITRSKRQLEELNVIGHNDQKKSKSEENYKENQGQQTIIDSFKFSPKE